jgi:hypothetical protein
MFASWRFETRAIIYIVGRGADDCDGAEFSCIYTYETWLAVVDAFES